MVGSRGCSFVTLANNFPTRAIAGLENNSIKAKGITRFRLSEEQSEKVAAFSAHKGDFNRTLLLVPVFAAILGLEDDAELADDPASGWVDKHNAAKSKVFR